MEAALALDAPLERLVDGRPVPVLLHGHAVSGEVILRVPPGASPLFHGLSLQIASRLIAPSGSHSFPPKEAHELLPTHAAHDATGGMRVRFVLPADALPRTPSYSGGGGGGGESILLRRESILLLRHELVLLLRRPADELRLVQPFELQCVEAAPPAFLPPADRAWVSVADFGGSCRLELCGGEAIDLKGEIRAQLLLHGTAPVRKVALKLLSREDDGPLRVLHVWTLWDAFLDDPIDERTGLRVELPLKPLGLEPSIAIHTPTATIKVRHFLRLVLLPPRGEEAWNTLDVRLVRTAPEGFPRGTLPATAQPAARAGGLRLTHWLVAICACLAAVALASAWQAAVSGAPFIPRATMRAHRRGARAGEAFTNMRRRPDPRGAVWEDSDDEPPEVSIDGMPTTYRMA
ncbi:hypothetical protein AB1Y20_014823 [Prymnesium parvum]|uniref:Transmembrane protein 231 n=1 Tax=Prymnesium parvum TaxID=97485 RepID=A0AB34JUX1_PRYPA